MEFVKAHGTGNDFVVVEDLNDRYRITPELVRVVCDRHFGVGADGLIRIARHRGAVLHGLPQRRRFAGRDVRQRGPGGRQVPGRPRPRRQLARPGDPRRGQAPGAARRRRGVVDRVTVDMGAPVLEEERALDVDGEAVSATVLSHGQPARRGVRGRRRQGPGDHPRPHPGDPPGLPPGQDQRRVRPGGRPDHPPPANLGAGRRRDPGLRHRRLRGRGGRPGPGLAGHPLVIELRGGRLELDWSPAAPSA